MQQYNCHILTDPEPLAFSSTYSQKFRSASDREHSIHCIKIRWSLLVGYTAIP
jgi:hypothetical protein